MAVELLLLTRMSPADANGLVVMTGGGWDSEGRPTLTLLH